jgi:sugar transferase (PEP-CTERM/EpsH1 system associated)
VAELLFLTHRLPYPPDKGDKIRSYQLLRHFSQRYNVHLGCFIDDPADLEHVPTVAAMCSSHWMGRIRPRLAKATALTALAGGRPLTFDYFRSRALRRWVQQVRAQATPTVEFAFSSSMAPFLLHEPSPAMRIVDFVDLDSEKWRRYAQTKEAATAWVFAREARLLAEAETRIARCADAVLLVSQPEADELKARSGVPHERVHVVGNGVDLAYFSSASSCARPKDIAENGPLLVFTGMMDYWANVDGIRWFCRDVLPMIKSAHPNVRVAIVGARPVREVEKLREIPGVTVTGRVPDVRPWLERAALAIVPLRIARGIQNKLLEAMAMGKAVVATTDAASGLEAEAGKDFLLASSAREFSRAVIGLLNDPARREALGERARRRVEASYGWQPRLRTLDAVLDQGGMGPRGTPLAIAS